MEAVSQQTQIQFVNILLVNLILYLLERGEDRNIYRKSSIVTLILQVDTVEPKGLSKSHRIWLDFGIYANDELYASHKNIQWVPQCSPSHWL